MIQTIAPGGPKGGHQQRHDAAHGENGLLDDLRTIVAMPVDLVMHDAIRNEYFRTSIDRERRMLYAA